MEYVTDEFIEWIFAEIDTETMRLLLTHSLIKAWSKDYVRDSQIRIILKPIADRLLIALRKAGSEQKLKKLLVMLRETYSYAQNYAAGNILNLLIQLQSNLSNYDFSHLVICQAYLQGVALQNTNFSYTNFVEYLSSPIPSGIFFR